MALVQTEGARVEDLISSFNERSIKMIQLVQKRGIVYIFSQERHMKLLVRDKTV